MSGEEIDEFEGLYGRGPKHAALIAMAREALALRSKDAQELENTKLGEENAGSDKTPPSP